MSMSRKKVIAKIYAVYNKSTKISEWSLADIQELVESGLDSPDLLLRLMSTSQQHKGGVTGALVTWAASRASLSYSDSPDMLVYDYEAQLGTVPSPCPIDQPPRHDFYLHRAGTLFACEVKTGVSDDRALTANDQLKNASKVWMADNVLWILVSPDKVGLADKNRVFMQDFFRKTLNIVERPAFSKIIVGPPVGFIDLFLDEHGFMFPKDPEAAKHNVVWQYPRERVRWNFLECRSCMPISPEDSYVQIGPWLSLISQLVRAPYRPCCGVFSSSHVCDLVTVKLSGSEDRVVTIPRALPIRMARECLSEVNQVRIVKSKRSTLTLAGFGATTSLDHAAMGDKRLGGVGYNDPKKYKVPTGYRSACIEESDSALKALEGQQLLSWKTSITMLLNSGRSNAGSFGDRFMLIGMEEPISPDGRLICMRSVFEADGIECGNCDDQWIRQMVMTPLDLCRALRVNLQTPSATYHYALNLMQSISRLKRCTWAALSGEPELLASVKEGCSKEMLLDQLGELGYKVDTKEASQLVDRLMSEYRQAAGDQPKELIQAKLAEILCCVLYGTFDKFVVDLLSVIEGVQPTDASNTYLFHLRKSVCTLIDSVSTKKGAFVAMGGTYSLERDMLLVSSLYVILGILGRDETMPGCLHVIQTIEALMQVLNMCPPCPMSTLVEHRLIFSEVSELALDDELREWAENAMRKWGTLDMVVPAANQYKADYPDIDWDDPDNIAAMLPDNLMTVFIVHQNTHDITKLGDMRGAMVSSAIAKTPEVIEWLTRGLAETTIIDDDPAIVGVMAEKGSPLHKHEGKWFNSTDVSWGELSPGSLGVVVDGIHIQSRGSVTMALNISGGMNVMEVRGELISALLDTISREGKHSYSKMIPMLRESGGALSQIHVSSFGGIMGVIYDRCMQAIDTGTLRNPDNSNVPTSRPTWYGPDPDMILNQAPLGSLATVPRNRPDRPIDLGNQDREPNPVPAFPGPSSMNDDWNPAPPPFVVPIMPPDRRGPVSPLNNVPVHPPRPPSPEPERRRHYAESGPDIRPGRVRQDFLEDSTSAKGNDLDDLFGPATRGGAAARMRRYDRDIF